MKRKTPKADKSPVALITGASSGIGEAIAIALQQKGYVVYTGARRIERMEHLKALDIQPVRLDVSDDSLMRSVVQRVKKEYGTIDVLVNSAGYGLYGAIEDIPMEDAHKQIEVNLFGLARMTQLVLPLMREQHGGKIINITSVGGKITTPFGGWYHASKFAVEGFSDSLRNEVKQFGVDVIIIEPGGVRTEGCDIAMDSLLKNTSDSVYESLAEKTLNLYAGIINRKLEPSVVGKRVARILSAKKLKPRYTIGHLGLVVFMRRFVSDRMYDRIMMAILKSS